MAKRSNIEYARARRPDRFVVYLRQSTEKQEESGWGRKAQMSAVRDLVKRENGQIARVFTDTECGDKHIDERPELAKAIQFAKAIGGRLIVSRLDRLLRNIAVLGALRDSQVDFICCDCPNATPTTIGFMALQAEDELRRIRDRTKQSLAVKKAEGAQLGARNPKTFAALNQSPESRANRVKGGLARVEAVRQEYRERVNFLGAYVIQLREASVTLAEIAEKLNAQGFQVRGEKPYTAQSVQHLYNKAKELDARQPLPRNQLIDAPPTVNLGEEWVSPEQTAR